MSSVPLRVGIAGYGVVGKRRRQVIDIHPALTTVAVCDRQFGGDGRLDDGVAYFDVYVKLLDQELDILFVCLTNDIAAEVTVAGLDRGLHVFCEKPPGRNLADVRGVVNRLQDCPTQKLKYGFNHRYHDSVMDALKLINSGELGAIINLRGIYGKSAIINFESDWRTQRAIAGGGILLDQGIHLVDLMRLFAGEFEEIHSVVTNTYWHHDVEDNAYALMRSKSGAVAMLHSSATQWRHRFGLDIAMEEGSINLSGILSGSKSYGAEILTVSRKSENDQGDPREVTTCYETDHSWWREVEEFADAVIDDQPICIGSVHEAFETMRLVYRIYCADPRWRDKWLLSDDPG